MIFGKGNPIMKATDDSFEIELLFTGIIPDFKNKIILENISPINGERDYVNLWDHTDFELRVYLYRHNDPTGFYNQISQMESKEIYFKPHKYRKDGMSLAQWLKDKDGNDQVFYCSNFNPSYLNNYNKFDIIEIVIKSMKPSVIEAYSTGILKV